MIVAMFALLLAIAGMLQLQNWRLHRRLRAVEIIAAIPPRLELILSNEKEIFAHIAELIEEDEDSPPAESTKH